MACEKCKKAREKFKAILAKRKEANMAKRKGKGGRGC